MHPQRKQRLIIILFMLSGIGVAVALLMTALEENINLFYTPKDIAAGKAPKHQSIRAGGMVVEGSVKRDQTSLVVQFDVSDGAENVTIEYDGILPDLFREGQGIVALGALNDDGIFVASEVLAKHDENYMPPEVKDALDKAHQDKAYKDGNASTTSGSEYGNKPANYNLGGQSYNADKGGE